MYPNLLFLFLLHLPQAMPEKELYLIPKGYIGNITILHGQQNGAPKKYEGGRRVYIVPACGVLKTQFPEQFGWIEDMQDQFKFVRYDGNKRLDTVAYYEPPGRGISVLDTSKIGQVFVYMRANGGASSDVDHYSYHQIVMYGIDTLKNISKYNSWHPADHFLKCR